jgi:tetratricopeptide (TPR) repeat protein
MSSCWEVMKEECRYCRSKAGSCASGDMRWRVPRRQCCNFTLLGAACALLTLLSSSGARGSSGGVAAFCGPMPSYKSSRPSRRRAAAALFSSRRSFLQESAALVALVSLGGASTCDTVLAADDEILLDEPSTSLPPGSELQRMENRAVNLGSTAQFDRSIGIWNTIVKYAPGYVYGYSNRGNVRVALGDLSGAVSDYSKALELEEHGDLHLPDHWLILVNRGTTFLAQDRNKEALSDLKSAAGSRGADMLLVLPNRAIALERAKQYDLAVKDYEAAAEKEGKVQPWWLRYAVVLFESGRRADALGIMRRVTATFPDVAETRAALTAILYGTGNTIEAEKEFNQIPVIYRSYYLDKEYTVSKLKWPPSITQSLDEFGRVEGLR